MKIESTSNLFNGNDLSRRNKDSALDGIQKQIQRTQEELSKLSNNEIMDVKEKLDKRKELEDQLLELNKQFAQQQLEEKQAEQKKQTEAIQEQLEATTASSQKSEAENQTGFSKSSVQSILSASSSMEQAKSINHVRTQMNGEAHVLKGQIALAESKGANPAELRKQLSSLEKQIGQVTANMLDKYSDAIDLMKKAVEDQKGKTNVNNKSASGEVQDEENQSASIASENNRMMSDDFKSDGVELLI